MSDATAENLLLVEKLLEWPMDSDGFIYGPDSWTDHIDAPELFTEWESAGLLLEAMVKHRIFPTVWLKNMLGDSCVWVCDASTEEETWQGIGETGAGAIRAAALAIASEKEKKETSESP